jgi:hypothetical protein
MNGEDFYTLLRKVYHDNKNQHIYDNRHFVRWLPKKNVGTSNFQFKFPSKNNEKDNVKSIPKLWLVDAKNAQNGGETINRNWFNHHFNRNNFNDCRASVARWLLQNHQPFL